MPEYASRKINAVTLAISCLVQETKLSQKNDTASDLTYILFNSTQNNVVHTWRSTCRRCFILSFSWCPVPSQPNSLTPDPNPNSNPLIIGHQLPLNPSHVMSSSFSVGATETKITRLPRMCSTDVIEIVPTAVLYLNIEGPLATRWPAETHLSCHL